MNNAQKGTLLIAWLSLLAVNVNAGFMFLYKGAYPVGRGVVSVSVPESGSSDVTVPIDTGVSGDFKETGQRVVVMLRSDHRAAEIQGPPRLTVLLLFGFAILYAIVTRITTRSQPEPRLEPRD